MFEKSDDHNKKILEEQNRTENPLVTRGATWVLSWPGYAAIAVILVGLLVLLGYQALQ